MPLRDRSVFYVDLMGLPSNAKNEFWAAQCLYFIKKNARIFLDPKKAVIYRATDRLETDSQKLKEMVDPVTPLGGGGKAEYFSADWKANPIYIHLKNIVKAEIEKSGKQLEVNLTDKYAKTRRMDENYRILYQNAFRTIINELAPQIGLPKISESQDPFKWAQNLTDKKQSPDDIRKQPSDVVDKYVDLIRNQISDSQDLALYNELIYKGDYEMAFELGIDYYLMSLNKWQERWADEFVDDLMHFNKACGEWYTDQITGRPVIERFVPERLWVSPFRRKDGEDLMYYFTEYEITFADFAKEMGRNLSEEKLKQVFTYQKTQGASHGQNWVPLNDTPNKTRDNAMIRVGKAAILAQDLSVFMDDIIANNIYQPMPATWLPEAGDTAERIEKYYNVWYSWYYIPPTTNSLSNADYTWQAQFIFDLKKNQDQFRTGEDGRFTKSPLVIYDNSSQATFTDITQEYMTKINYSWQAFQNYLVNDFDAVLFADDFIGSLVAAVDEDNKIDFGDPKKATGGNGRDAYMQQWKQIKQGGKGFLKMTDKNGVAMTDPTKFAFPIKNGYLEKAEKTITLILVQYDLMIKSLALSPLTTGEEVKPRTPVAALEQSLKASDSATFFIQKGYEDFLKMYAERMVRYILTIAQEAKEGNTKRFDEFMDNVGYANGLAVEGMADVPPESVGLTVSYVDNTAKKEFIMSLATEYIKTKEINEDFLYLIMGCENWKYSLVLMRMAIKQRRKEIQAENQQAQQNIMEQKQMDLQIAQALQGQKIEGSLQGIQLQGQINAALQEQLNQIKHASQSGLTQQKTESKFLENQQKSDLLKDQKTHEKVLEESKPFAGQAA